MNERMESMDVLVVGLGPAGSRAARAAALEGLSIVAIDRRRRPGFPVQCAEFIPALMEQEIAGLDGVTRQHIHSMATFVEREEPDLRENFRGRMVDRGEFDRVLVKAARDAGADCRFGLQLDGLAADGTATISDGTRIAPRVIVGADGPRSVIGGAIGQVNQEIVETRQISVPLLKPYETTDIFLSADIVGGYAWLFPRGEIANIGLGMAPGERHRLKPLLEELHAMLIAEGRVGRGVVGHTGGAIPVGGMLNAVGASGRRRGGAGQSGQWRRHQCGCTVGQSGGRGRRGLADRRWRCIKGLPAGVGSPVWRFYRPGTAPPPRGPARI
jgi:flavin-dependent dehydrogenase